MNVLFRKCILHTALIMVLGSLQACNKLNEYSDNDSEAVDSIISTVPVKEGYMKDELILNGNVVCDESKVSKIFIPCSGKIENVKIEAGDRVSKGQFLASIFSQEAAEYNKQCRDLDAEINIAKRELSMLQDMLKSGLTSDKEVERAQSRMDIAMAEKSRLQSVANVNGFANNSHASITSPISGYVFSKNVYNGSYIDDSNNDIPAFEIADLKSIWVVADVYESDIHNISQDASVNVKVLAYPEKTFQGKIDKIYRHLDNESKTMKVRICLDNSKGWLMPGMFANVYVCLSGTGRRMMQIPSECIVFENGSNHVVLADTHGKLRRQKVKVVHQDEHTAYVENGIKVGDRVVNKNTLLEYNNLR